MNLIEELQKQGLESAHLDDLVHDAANDLASNANNGGMKEQINFLITICGWTEKDIKEKLKEGAHIDFEYLHPVREEEGSKQLPSNVIEGYCVMASGDLGYSDEYTYYSKEKHILEGIVNEVIKDAPDLEIKAATLIIKEKLGETK